MAWNESKKYLISFDKSKIAEDLVGFPFVVALNGTDHPDFFAEMLIDPDDDFTGNDGDDIDFDRWIMADPDCDIQSNKCYMEETGAYCRINTRTVFQGDFDIQVDFSDLLNSNAYSWTVEMTAVSVIDGHWVKIRRCYDAAQYYRPQSYDGSTHTLTSFGTSDSSGKFRLTRVGTTVKTWRWTGSAWSEVAEDTYDAIGSDDIYIQLSCGSWGGNPLTKVSWDNFTVNSADGFIYTYRRKRVAFYSGGDQYTGYKCHAEIEHFDTDAEEAIYHVWAPELFYGKTNTLQMYFDATQRDQHDWTLTPAEASYSFTPPGTWLEEEAEDDFTGIDGDDPDLDRWNLPTGYDWAVINSNKLRMASPGGSAANFYQNSRFCITGDFDIQIRLTLTATPSTDNWYFNFQMNFPGGVVVQCMRLYATAAGQVVRFSRYDGSSWTNDTESETGSDIYLRISRSGSTIHCYRSPNGSSWDEIGSGVSLTSDPGNIVLRHTSGGSYPAMTGDWDDFTITSSGTIYDHDVEPNPNEWPIITGTPQIINNHLRLRGASSTDYEQAGASFYLLGDFDVQVDFKLNTHPETDLWSIWLNVGNSYSWYHRLIREYRSSIGGNVYCHTSWDLSTWHREGTTVRDDLTGKLRFVRSGDTFSSYGWWSSTWNLIATSAYAKTTEPIFVSMGVSSGTGNPIIQVDWINFTVNSADGISDTRWMAAKRLIGQLPLTYDEEDVEDRFRGDDDDPPNPDLWRQIDAATIQSNKLDLDATSLDAYVESLFNLSGDFEVQIDFSNVSAGTVNYQGVGIQLIQDSNNLVYVRAGYKSGVYFISNTMTGGSWDTEGNAARTNDWGKLKILRSGSNITVQKQDGSGSWGDLITSRACWSGDVKIQLRAWRVSSAVTGEIDNFFVNSADDIIRAGYGSDVFTGTDGDPPDPNKWSRSLQVSGYCEIQSNKLRIKADSTYGGVATASRYLLSGDFDLQVDFDLVTYPATGNWSVTLEVQNPTTGYLCRTEYRYDSNYGWYANYYDGSWGSRGTYLETLTSSRLRIARSGSTITYYRWTGSAWVSLGTDTTTLGTGEVFVRLNVNSWSGFPTASADFDNLLINQVDDIYESQWPANINFFRPEQFINARLQNGRLCLFGDSASFARAVFRHRLSGDFDIQVQFDLITYPSTTGWGSTLRVSSVDSGYHDQVRICYTTAFYYNSQYFNGSWNNVTSTATSDTTGRLRMVRSGSTIYFYWWNGTDWTALGSSTSGVGSDDVDIRLFQEAWSGMPDTETEFYNFRISGADDVAGWIGDTGEYPAREMWDTDFRAVYHMAQDPSGGSDSVLDSTLQENHLTPAGSMTSADLVAGQIGKAIDLDGSDDRMVSAGQIIDITGDFSLEALFEVQAFPAESQVKTIIAEKDGTGTGRGYIQIYNETTTLDKLFATFLGGTQTKGTTDLSQDVTYYGAVLYTAGSPGSVALRVNNAEENSAAVTAEAATGAFVIGSHKDEALEFYDGLLDEVRISQIRRSSAWHDATYFSLFDLLVTVALATEKQQPATPSITSVTELYKTTCTLNGSTFSDPDGDLHESSQWQVDFQSGDFSTPEVDSGETGTYLTSYPVTGLTGEEDYKARVRYKDDSGDAGTEWSEWSLAYNFTTKGDWTGIVFSGLDPADQELQVTNDREILADITDNWYSFDPADITILIEGEQYTNLDPELDLSDITDGKRLTWTPPYNYDYGRGNEVNVRIDAENSHADQSYVQWSFFGFWYLTTKDMETTFLFRQLCYQEARLILFFRQACKLATELTIKFRYGSGVLSKGVQAQTSFIIGVRSLLYGMAEPTVFVCELKRLFGQGSANIADPELIAGEASANIYGVYLVLSGGDANIQAYQFFVVPAGSADIVVDYVQQAEASGLVGIPTDTTGEGSARIFKNHQGVWIRINAIPPEVKAALEEIGVEIDA